MAATTVLGIESTCDETACAVVREGQEILSNVIASQTDLHALYGGVVPELACRRHIDVLIPTLDEALSRAQVDLHAIDLFAVAHAPGLIGALFIGVEAAKTLSLALRKPLVAVNHVEAHLYGAIMSASEKVTFPALGVVLSGGHTALLLMHGIGSYTLLSQTVDDAIGEAFDKAAKILGLPYPGGPVIEQLAKKGDPHRFPFHGGRVKEKPLHFSFSGLKTALLYAVQKIDGPLPKEDLAAAFQKAALEDVVKKTLMAVREYRIDTVVFGGGVTQNRHLRALFAHNAPQLRTVWPEPALCLDNAAMIAGLGYHTYRRSGPAPLTLSPKTRVTF